MTLSDDKLRKMFVTVLVGFIIYISLKLSAKLYGKSQLCKNLLGDQYVFGHFKECRSKVGEITMHLIKDGSTKNLPQSYLDAMAQIGTMSLIVEIVGYLIIIAVLVRCILIFRISQE